MGTPSDPIPMYSVDVPLDVTRVLLKATFSYFEDRVSGFGVEEVETEAGRKTRRARTSTPRVS